VAGYLEEVAARWGLTAELHHELTVEPSPEAAITLYRICQEALSNVHKHARAARVDVRLSTVDKGLLLRVTDDGVGTTAGAIDPGPGHFGLIEMRERAEAAHGWWSLSSTLGAGTTVECWLPALPDEDR